jgi:6-phosphogluconate dehydrogenase
MNKQADVGLIGLAVMGGNLALNMERNGLTAAVYSWSNEEIKRFANGLGNGKNIIIAHSIEEFIAALKPPRKIMLMIKAGKPVDDVIETLIPLLAKGDVIIDGGNSNFHDTIRRNKYLEEKGLLFIGAGVSGGGEGALKGASIMAGGSKAAWPLVEPILKKIAAKTDDGLSCCDWIGENGAGHFVKMSHNGIEYGDMQLISEAYLIMRDLLKMSADEMSATFAEWNKGELNSYLIEITSYILAVKDDDGEYLTDKILDTAGQKGTGKWAAAAALDLSVPLTLISEAVYGRFLSAMKNERVEASKILRGPEPKFEGDKTAFIDDVRRALYASKIIAYAQGFAHMSAASVEYKWNLNFGSIASIWRGGCIIRSEFLNKIKEAYDDNPSLSNLLLAPFFNEKIEGLQTLWRRVAAASALNGIWTPAISSALSYYDGFRTERLPANLLQAQRDYFGAHTYERIDKPRGEFFHTDWSGKNE